MTEHDKEMVEIASNHFDLMRLADKLKLLHAMKDVCSARKALKALDAFVEITHEARVSGYNYGVKDVRKIR
jgi:hypothetical protein